jgi:hypothetical protein
MEKKTISGLRPSLPVNPKLHLSWGDDCSAYADLESWRITAVAFIAKRSLDFLTYSMQSIAYPISHNQSVLTDFQGETISCIYIRYSPK